MRTIKYPADFLSPPSRAVFDIDLISGALDKLTPYNSVVFVGSPNFVNENTPTNPQGLPLPNLDSVEPWFNTSFAKVDTPCEVLNGWHVDDIATKLSLPPENSFIPKSLDIHPLDKDHSKKPILINNDNGKSINIGYIQKYACTRHAMICSGKFQSNFNFQKFLVKFISINYYNVVIVPQYQLENHTNCQYVLIGTVLINTKCNNHCMYMHVGTYTGLSVWWLQDDQFFSPKINMVCSMETPVAYNSSKNYG